MIMLARPLLAPSLHNNSPPAEGLCQKGMKPGALVYACLSEACADRVSLYFTVHALCSLYDLLLTSSLPLLALTPDWLSWPPPFPTYLYSRPRTSQPAPLLLALPSLLSLALTMPALGPRALTSPTPASSRMWMRASVVPRAK